MKQLLMTLLLFLSLKSFADPSQVARTLREMNNPDSTTILIAAHRGGYETDVADQAPENSVANILNCQSKGFDLFETDIQRTKDGHFVMVHDPTISRETTGEGSVKDMTLAELKQLKKKYRNGAVSEARIATLEEFLQQGNGHIIFKVDLKPGANAYFKEIMELVVKYDMMDGVVFRIPYSDADLFAQYKADGVPFTKSLLMFKVKTPKQIDDIQARFDPLTIQVDVKKSDPVNPKTLHAIQYATRKGLLVETHAEKGEEEWVQLADAGVRMFHTKEASKVQAFLNERAVHHQTGDGMKLNNALFGMAISTATLAAGAQAAENPPMNVLFLAVDDLKPMLGCYGNERIMSPNIDRLADGGTVFLNNHCQWPVCGPSRASLMTGLMPEETGVMGFRAMRHKLPDVITLPQHFRNNGYVTAAVGKLNDPRCVGPLNPKDPGGRTLGGREIDDLPSWSIPYAHYSDVGGGYQSPTKRSCESPDLADIEMNDGAVAERGLELLEEIAKTGKPFFLGIGFYKPHVPWYAPKKYWDLYDRDSFELAEFEDLPQGGAPGLWKKGTEVHGFHDTPNTYKSPETGELVVPRIPDEKQRELIHSYYACVSFIDAQVGRILAKLEALGLADNTIIVLWGDHGYHLGDHGQWGKHTLMEGATRTPMIIMTPKIKNAVAETHSPSGLIDMYRTICELAELPVPEQPKSKNKKDGRAVKGVSLVPVMTGEKDSVREGIITFKGGYAFRTERYRYVEFIKNGKVISRDLYDYQEDPLETVNLATDKKYAKLVKELAKTMRESPEAEGCDGLMK